MKNYRTFSLLARKLNIKKESLINYQIGDSRFLLPFLISTFVEIKNRILKDSRNHNVVDEFSTKSRNPWGFLKEDESLLTLARLLTMHSGRNASVVRAKCTQPIMSEELKMCVKEELSDKVLWRFLAEQMETSVEELNKDMLVKDIILPFTGYDKHSWLTFICWSDRLFGTHLAEEDPAQLKQMSVKELFPLWRGGKKFSKKEGP